MATWYGARAHGHPTANGERFDRNALTAAHRTLPLNSRVRVVNLDNGQSVVVRITDRGPQAWTHRDIDLSEAAAREIGMIRSGVAHVRIEPL
jgi:rare lipoprotein A